MVDNLSLNSLYASLTLIVLCYNVTAVDICILLPWTCCCNWNEMPLGYEFWEQNFRNQFVAQLLL